ncbi:MAG: energy-coupling factor transporter transmembrane component T [Spirochaetales bacterium]|nr:energy-coupling factor transporter transmembrane component T [Spirochaetales bacterium]
MKTNYLFEYYPHNSLLFRLNPLFKLIVLIAFCVLSALPNIWTVSISALISLFFTLSSGKHIRTQFFSMWKIFIFFILTGIIKYITSNSIQDGVFFCTRLITMTAAGLLFYSTTKLSALRRLLSKIISKKAADLFVMMLSFLPLIFKTAEELKEARYSRSFKSDKRVLRSFKLITIPLLIEMFQKVDEMADAWYSRGYNSDK